MKKYTWNSEKNEHLKRDRNISFEKIVFHIKNGDEIDVYEHPNQLKYPGQKISVIKINNYAFLVPFIETENEIFFKTIIPNRKATKKYLRGKNE
ncbi:toxin [Candidatus Magnetomorum sp. HK-1]|nr:toxin [Candidatus Magnetomorum sp. HK-1]